MTDRADRIRRLNQAAMSGDCLTEIVHCDTCGDVVRLETDFGVDEDGRAYCENCRAIGAHDAKRPRHP